MARDPYTQREDDRAAEDEDYARDLADQAAERTCEHWPGPVDPEAVARAHRHLEVIADALEAPGTAELERRRESAAAKLQAAGRLGEAFQLRHAPLTDFLGGGEHV